MQWRQFNNWKHTFERLIFSSGSLQIISFRRLKKFGGEPDPADSAWCGTAILQKDIHKESNDYDDRHNAYAACYAFISPHICRLNGRDNAAIK